MPLLSSCPAPQQPSSKASTTTPQSSNKDSLSTLPGFLLQCQRVDEAGQERRHDLQYLIVSTGERGVMTGGMKRVLVWQGEQVDGREYRYRQVEGTFSQPNGVVCQHMLSWARHVTRSCSGDLVELYCGNGNFTVALADNFG
jgi:tRNA (uracil-5-)-methyltransferase